MSRVSGGAPGSAPRGGPLTALPYLPALVVLLLYAWALLEHGVAVVAFPFQIDYGEMPELNRAVLLAQGQPIYVDWSVPPYQMANYTPLYSLATAPGVALWGPQFHSGRLLSLVSTLATSLAVGATAGALSGRRRAALIGGLLYLAGYPVWNWGALQRVDAFAVALEWVAIALFALAWRCRRPVWALWATVPLLLGAVYARQTVVAGAFAVFGTALFLRPRLGLAALAVYAGAGLALFALLEGSTAGQFRRHIVDGNLNDWAWVRVDYYWQPFWALLHWALILGAAGLALGLGGTRSPLAPLLPLLYTLGAAATALTIGKIGSNVNYLLPLWAALSLLGGLGAGYAAALPRWAAALASTVLAGWLLVGLQQAYHVPFEPSPVGAGGTTPGATRGVPAAVLGAARFAQLPLWRLDPWGAPPDLLLARAQERYSPLPTAAEASHAAQAAAHLDTLDGDLLGEEMSFTVTSGRRIYLQPFEFSQLALQGVWDQGPLLADVRRGHFQAVVLRFRLDDDPGWRGERINPALLGALREHYALEAVFGDYFVYRHVGDGADP